MFGLTPYNRRNTPAAGKNDIWDMRNVFEGFFNDSFFPTVFSSSGAIKADIRETEKEYIIDAEIPGVRKEDIKIELRDDILTVGVEHNEEVNEERNNFIRRERRYGAYSRSFHVDNVKNEDVTAKYDNGVLTINLPKSEGNKVNRHRINIQ